MKKIILFVLLFSNQNIYSLNISGQVVNTYEYSNKKQYAPGVFVPLLSWRDSTTEKCLLYKTPLRKTLGSLYLIPSGQCDLSKVKKEFIYKEDIRNFSFEKNNQGYSLNYNDIKEVITFPMSEGLSYLSTKKTSEKKIKNGMVCRKMNARCDLFEINECAQCESSIWTPSLNWKCARKSQRICGALSCGHKNQIACLRALHTSKNTLNCDEAKELTYCRKGLQIICEGDGRVTCR